jgi:hypothetical protein
VVYESGIESFDYFELAEFDSFLGQISNACLVRSTTIVSMIVSRLHSSGQVALGAGSMPQLTDHESEP